jgi:F-type H+-transporting ATPase subunit epsilon
MQYPLVLEILTPDKHVYKGNVTQATLPGAKAPFVVMHNHAPIISVLQKGNLCWIDEKGDGSVEISGGFVEVDNNVITACVELL